MRVLPRYRWQVACLLAWPLAALAAVAPEAAPARGGAATTTPFGSGAVLELLVGLGLVLLVIFALAWALRRFGAGAWMQARGMRVVASLPLGTRERAVLVEVGGKQLLLGVTSQQVTLLHAFDDPVVTGPANTGGEFGQRLREALGHRGAR